MKKNLTIFLPLVLAIIAIGGFAVAQKKARSSDSQDHHNGKRL